VAVAPTRLTELVHEGDACERASIGSSIENRTRDEDGEEGENLGAIGRLDSFLKAPSLGIILAHLRPGRPYTRQKASKNPAMYYPN
jgi:hypothetical protein